jgi:hypothetical protein
MKKIFIRVMVIFLAFLFIYSCKKTEYTEQDALNAHKDFLSYQDSINFVRDSLNHLGGIIQYSVNVVPVNGTTSFVGSKSESSVKGLTDAVVSVAQHGKVMTQTTKSDGIAVFYDLRVGTVSVNVTAKDYSTIDYIAEIKPESDTSVNKYYDVLRYAATMVPMFSLTQGLSTIKGKVTYETNLTNTAPENAKGIEVIGMIDTDQSHFITNFFKQLFGDNLKKYNAKIVQAAFAGLVDTAMTNTSGDYTLRLPSTADGLCAKIDISDIAVDQQLLMNTVNGQVVHGVQTIRTIFGSGQANYGETSPSIIPFVNPAYVTFSAPTGTVSEQPDIQALATAVVSESGIAAIVINDQGSGYTQAPLIKITGDGTGAEAVAYISNGKVTSIEITKKGQGYTTASITVTDKAGDDASATALITYSITKINMTNNGSGYKSKPNILISSGTGTGATGEAVMSGYVSKINMTNAGNGYVCPPDVFLTGSTQIDAKATPVMTTYNPIHSIELAKTFLTRYETTPTVTIQTTGTGSGATAIATLAAAGSVKNSIVINDGGSGYLEAPTVLIVGGGGSGAVADAAITLGVVTSITVRKGGDGYTSNPTVQISAPPSAGTQATATAVREFPIASITLTNAGSGYNISYLSTNIDLYTNEPNVLINGVAIATDADVIVRPNMNVESIGITPGYSGSGYTAAPTVTITPNCGFGSGATATAEILYKVDYINLLTKGSGYHYGDFDVAIVTPVDGCITQAKATAVAGEGVLSSLNLIAGGDGYTASPNFKILAVDFAGTSCEKDAVVTATISNGKITALTIVDPGIKYVYRSSFEVDISTHISIASFTATPYPESGKISFITISNPGQGYVVPPLVKFTRYNGNEEIPTPLSGHNFVDAQATAVIEDGRVVAVNITNPGTGYYIAPLVELVIPNYLELAKGTVVVNADGYVTGITVSSGGMGYSAAPTVTISPSVTAMGSGATGVAVIQEGSVSYVKLTSSGSGYLGKNTPSSAKGVKFLPEGSAQNTFDLFAGKTYIQDIYLGTGKRTICY